MSRFSERVGEKKTDWSVRMKVGERGGGLRAC